MSEPTNNGELLLPVCIPETEIRDLISAIDLYRVMRKGGQVYPALDAVFSAIDIIETPEQSPCLPTSESSGTCFRMDTTTEIFEFGPNNPFDRTDNAKTSTSARWMRFEDIADDFIPEWLESAFENANERIGYFPNDVFVVFDNPGFALLNPVDSFNSFIDGLRSISLFPFPTIKFEFSGAGQVEIKFAQVPFGGAVLITWDFQPTLDDVLDLVQGKQTTLTNFQLVEVNRDLVGVPPELVTEAIWEQEFSEDSPHSITCYFAPSGQLEPPFVLPYGGIREIEFCGDIEVIGAETGNTYNQFNFRDPRAVRNGVLPVSTVDDFYNALVRWTDERAVRWLAGQGQNVRDGVRIDPRSGVDGGFDIELRDTVNQNRVIELPPNTGLQEIQYGQALQVGQGFRSLVNEIIGWRNNSININTIVSRLFNFYGLIASLGEAAARQAFETDLDAAITAATDTVNPAVNVEAIANIVYCNGASKQSLYRYALDVEESSGQDVTDIAALYRLIIDSLDDSQIDAWYFGPAIPSLGFVNAPCYTFPSITFNLDSSNFTSTIRLFETGQRIAESPRQYRLSVSGKITLSNGNTYDGAYIVTPSDVATYTPFSLYVRTLGDINRSVQMQPQPVRSDNGYKFDALIDTNISPAGNRKIEGLQFPSSVINPTSGQLTIEVIDFGRI